MTQVGARDLREMLRQRLDPVLQKLFPQYRITHPTFTPLNPTRADKRPGSFVIWTSGAAAGGFHEYSPAFQASGDIIDLVAYVHRADRAYACAWAKDFLGIASMSREALTRAKNTARQSAAIEARSASQANAAKRQRANELFNKAVPIRGTLGETYLAARGIAFSALSNPEDDLRFMPKLEYWKLAEWDRSTKPWTKLKSGPKLPAMVAAMRNAAGDITAAHCTFLRSDGSGKADLPNAKLMRGEARGAMIRLTRGPENLTVEEAAAAGVIEAAIVAEGIETALSLALAIPEARVSAAGSFDLMMLAPIEVAIFDPAIYALDNDDNPKASAVVEARLDALRATGKRAASMRAHEGKDFNDLIRE